LPDLKAANSEQRASSALARKKLPGTIQPQDAWFVNYALDPVVVQFDQTVPLPLIVRSAARRLPWPVLIDAVPAGMKRCAAIGQVKNVTLPHKKTGQDGF
jgi:hypothetical protein